MDWRTVPDRGPLGAGDPTAPGAERRSGFHWMDVVMGIDVAVLALLFVPELLRAARILGGQEVGSFPLTSGLLYGNSAILLVAMGLVPFLWVWRTREGGWQGTLDHFMLRRPGLGIAWGTVVAFAMLVLLMVVGIIIYFAGGDNSNPAVEEMARVMTWPLALSIAFSAAFGEEILFRGILQRRIGWWGQAIIFGALHAYEGVYGILVTGTLGLLFGYLVHRRLGLWVVISAHFFFNAVQLAILMAVPT